MKFIKVKLKDLGEFPLLLSENFLTKEKSFLCLPTAEAIISLHDGVEEYCRKHNYDVPSKGLKSEGQLDFFEDKIRGKFERFGKKKKYKTILKLSEDILFEIACRHPFIDGNKRTALVCSSVFLGLNMLSYINNDKRYSSYVLNHDKKYILERGKKIELIADWNEDKTSDDLKTLLKENGIKFRKRITEDHIRQYIKKFLAEEFLEQRIKIK
ncbi:Fic family protein [Candidatus Micrarchaeota archaeon]|nr:Fic family protein [Candidatus Micrarchaeota archaeon]